MMKGNAVPKKNKTIKEVYDEYADQVLGNATMDANLLDAWDQRLANAESKMESNTLVGGTKLRTHNINECSGYWCCIHNPSPHHMRGWDQHWDEYDLMMYRICEHGMMHPDPDDPYEFNAAHKHRPACDGCCDWRDRIKRKSA